MRSLPQRLEELVDAYAQVAAPPDPAILRRRQRRRRRPPGSMPAPIVSRSVLLFRYQAVLTLLAVAAGYPTMADRLLVGLEDDAATKGDCWSDFVAALDPDAGESPDSLCRPARPAKTR